MGTETPSADIKNQMSKMGQTARIAARVLREAGEEQKNTALQEISQAIKENTKEILSANSCDLDRAKQSSLAPAMIDRLLLDEERLSGIVKSLGDIVVLPDPVGTTLSAVKRPNGLQIDRVRTPIGVIAVIYESRPNVTIDASALCLKSGNASILRSGSQAFETSMALYQSIQKGLTAADLPETCVQLVPMVDRAAVGAILSGLDNTIDLIIPRGGKSLVARVQEEARAPVLSHLDGICHVYVDGAADPEKAIAITLNAKMRRPGICGAAETLLIDQNHLDHFLPELVEQLQHAGCTLKADETIRKSDPSLDRATESDFFTEYLAPTLSIAAVNGVEGAIDHIAKYSSGHTEAIITEDKTTAERFLKSVDSAIVMHNASTQFADGGEFGLGAEIGIATGRLHARGPVGLEELTTYKNIVRGEGHIRA